MWALFRSNPLDGRVTTTGTALFTADLLASITAAKLSSHVRGLFIV